VRVGVGLFLLVAAGLKLHGLGLDPLASESFLSNPRLQIAAIEVEIVLGALLLLPQRFAASRWATRRVVVLFAIAFFGILSLVSLYQALDGQSSCGCFGVVAVSPWWTFGLDVGIVALLVISREQAAPVAPVGEKGGSITPSPPLGERGGGEGVGPAFARTALGAALFLALIAGGFFLWHDNPVAALAQLRGETIAVDPPVSDVGHASAGETRTFEIELLNHNDTPVRIVGGTTSCACIATQDLPVTLSPSGSATISVRMKFTGTPGRFQHRFILYTDNQSQPIVVARFTGRVVASAPSPPAGDRARSNTPSPALGERAGVTGSAVADSTPSPPTPVPQGGEGRRSGAPPQP
jgi:hypothetical protein